MDDTTTDPIVDVLVDSRLTDSEVNELVEQLTRLGMAPTARVRAMPTVRAEPVSWSLVLVVVLSAFLASISSQLGKDVYQALSRVIQRAVERRRDDDSPPDAPNSPDLPDPPDPPDGSGTSQTDGGAARIVVRDRDTGVEIFLEPDLPANVIDQLTLQPTPTSGPVLWDRHQRRWRILGDPDR